MCGGREENQRTNEERKVRIGIRKERRKTEGGGGGRGRGGGKGNAWSERI